LINNDIFDWYNWVVSCRKKTVMTIRKNSEKSENKSKTPRVTLSQNNQPEIIITIYLN